VATRASPENRRRRKRSPLSCRRASHLSFFDGAQLAVGKEPKMPARQSGLQTTSARAPRPETSCPRSSGSAGVSSQGGGAAPWTADYPQRNHRKNNDPDRHSKTAAAADAPARSESLPPPHEPCPMTCAKDQRFGLRRPAPTPYPQRQASGPRNEIGQGSPPTPYTAPGEKKPDAAVTARVNPRGGRRARTTTPNSIACLRPVDRSPRQALKPSTLVCRRPTNAPARAKNCRSRERRTSGRRRASPPQCDWPAGAKKDKAP